MDPFVGAGIAWAVLALKKRGERRRAARAILDAWDEKLKPHKGKPRKRINLPRVVRESIWILKGPCEGGDDVLETCDRHEEIDHRVPLTHGGSNYSDNLDPMCHLHNQRKHARLGTCKKKKAKRKSQAKRKSPAKRKTPARRKGR